MSMELATVIGQVITFLTVAIGFIVQYLRETRQHEWDREERMATAESLRSNTSERAADLAVRAAATEARLAAYIADNTEVSKVAFKEANDVNNKLHALGLKQLDKPRQKKAK